MLSNASPIREKGNTAHDAWDMARLGRPQEFRRIFSTSSMLGLSATLMVTWEAVFFILTIPFIDGGLPSAVYSYLWTWIMWTTMVIAMCDMASMAPASGGQYQWVSEFAPKSCQRFLSYMVGWLSALSWQATFASSSYLWASLLQGIAVLNYESYEPKGWHTTLITIATAAIGCLLNTCGARLLPTYEKAVLFLHIAAFIGFLAALWALEPHNKNSASTVFGGFINSGGWSSIGTAVIVGQAGTIFAFVGPDAAAHISEEIRDASVIVPRVMITSILLNGAMGFVMIITFCFCITDLGSALESPEGFPSFFVFNNLTGSASATTGMMIVLAVLLFNTVNGSLTAGSRQLFAFARDDGLPISWLLKSVSHRGLGALGDPMLRSSRCRIARFRCHCKPRFAPGSSPASSHLLSLAQQ